MLRTDALTYLVHQFAGLATVTGQATTDTAAGYGPALDQALRTLGYSADQLAAADVPDADTTAYLALAEYYALVRFSRALIVSVDEERQTGTGKRSRSNMADKVRALLEESRKALTEMGYLGAAWESGALSMDFLEPSAETA